MRDCLRLAVFQNLKLFALQIADQLALLVRDHNVNLHQFGVNAHGGGILWPWLFAFVLFAL